MLGLGLGVWGLGWFRVWGSGVEVLVEGWGLGFGVAVWGLGCGVWGFLGFGVWGLGVWGSGFAFRVWSLGL